jgi:hypothetical protein
MGLVGRGWDVRDLKFARTSLQKKTSCSAAG